jgi:hypothetical protein
MGVYLHRGRQWPPASQLLLKFCAVTSAGGHCGWSTSLEITYLDIVMQPIVLCGASFDVTSCTPCIYRATNLYWRVHPLSLLPLILVLLKTLVRPTMSHGSAQWAKRTDKRTLISAEIYHQNWLAVRGTNGRRITNFTDATSRKIARSIPDEVTASLSVYVILPVALWHSGLLNF